MAIVERDRLDAALGVDLVELNWTRGGVSYRNAQHDRRLYDFESRGALERILRRRDEPHRVYNVAYEADGRRGYCSCERFLFYTRKHNEPCKHLWLVRFLLDHA